MNAALASRGICLSPVACAAPEGPLVVDLEGDAGLDSNPLPPPLRSRGPLVCFSPSNEVTLGVFCENSSVQAVFGRGCAYDDPAFGETLGAIVGQKRSGGGASAYLAPNAPVHRRIVRQYSEKDECFASFMRFVEALPAFSEFRDLAVTCAWEMLMNAMFDAQSQAGAPQGARPAVMEFGADGRNLVLAVEDAYGSLKRSSIATAFARCRKGGSGQVLDGESGAGVGLYILFNSANQVHFTVRRDVVTRVVVVSRLTRRYREFDEALRSLSFVEEAT